MRRHVALWLPVAILTMDLASSRLFVAAQVRGGIHLGPAVAIPPSQPSITSAQVASIGPTGDLFVSGPDSAVIFRFGSSGKLLSVIGREGKGPGEFARIRAMGWVGDSLWVRDDGQRRFTLLTQQGELIRTFVPTRLQPRARTSAFLAFALIPGNRFVYLEGFDQYAQPALVASGARVVVAKNYQSEAVDTVGLLNPPIATPIQLLSGNGAALTVPQPWGGADVLAISPEGKRLIRVRSVPKRIDGKWTYEITAYGVNGEELYRRTVVFTPQAITDELVDEWLQRFNNPQVSSGFGSGEELRRQLREKLYRPTVVPPMLRPIVGTDGTVWVTRQLSQGGHECDVIDPSGFLLGSVLLPPKRRLLAATRDVLWVVQEEAGPDQAGIQLERILVTRL